MRGTLLGLAVLAALPATAGAATVHTEIYLECNGDPACAKYQAGSPEIQLTFRAAPGEANRVTTEPTGDGRVRVTDAGAPLQAGPNCEAATPNQAVCPFPRAAFVELGDGSDTIAFSLGVRTFVSGGAGADALIGGAPSERFDGGPGADRVDGGGGDDVLTGSAPGEPADALDGGDGADLVTYAAHTRPLAVSLDPAATANPDRLTRVEGVAGGAGDDVLTGSAGSDSLSGAGGDDVLRGAGGDDLLGGGPGRDAISAGDGADVLAVYDGARDRLSCGGGADRIAGQIDVDDYYDEFAWRGADPVDLLARDCERTALRGYGGETEQFLVDPRVRLLGRRAVLRNPCATIAARPCRGIVRVTGVAKRFRSGMRSVVVALPRVAARRRVRVAVQVRTGDDEHGGGWTARVG